MYDVRPRATPLTHHLQRHKVLFIASSLLNKYPTDNAGADHVAEFLAVVSRFALREVLSLTLERSTTRFLRIRTSWAWRRCPSMANGPARTSNSLIILQPLYTTHCM